MLRRFLAALAAAALIGVAGCGDDDDGGGPDAERAKPVGPESGGSVAQYADCGDWRKGTRAEREATIDELRGQLTAQTDKSAESQLSDESAYEVIERNCKPEWADKLRLYVLYSRAQGFAPLAD